MLTNLTESIKFIIDNQPPLGFESALYYGSHFVLISIILIVGRMILHLLLNKQLSHASKLYTSDTPKERKILILGDSTAVGTGATRAEDTIAGRLAHDFPNAQIINLAKNGGLICDLREQIDTVAHEVFDLVVLSAGGNDVWHISSLKKIDADLRYVLEKASMISNHRVIFLMYSIIASAPLFPGPIRFFLIHRSKKVQDAIHTVTRAMRIPAIELFTTESENPFLEKPRELFASDGIHPSSRGYQVWYNRMWLEMTRNGFRV